MRNLRSLILAFSIFVLLAVVLGAICMNQEPPEQKPIPQIGLEECAIQQGRWKCEHDRQAYCFPGEDTIGEGTEKDLNCRCCRRKNR